MALIYQGAARKALKGMPQAEAKRLHERLERLAAGDDRGLDVKSLVGQDRMRLRSGDWRAVFVQDGDDVIVVAIGHRREVYRRK